DAAAASAFAFGGPSGSNTAVITIASPTTSTIAGHVVLRGDNANNNVNFTVDDGAAATDLLVSAAITQTTGTNGITKQGSGLMLLTGSNTYAGPSNINSGTLQLG